MMKCVLPRHQHNLPSDSKDVSYQMPTSAGHLPRLQALVVLVMLRFDMGHLPLSRAVVINQSSCYSREVPMVL